MLKVIDGLRTTDGANSGTQIGMISRTAGTVNGPGVAMGGHFEALALVGIGSVAASTNCTYNVQESNDNSNFTNISGATTVFNASAANLSRVIGIDWKHPDRKAYARLVQIVAGAGAVVGGGEILRVNQNAGPVNTEASTIPVPVSS